MCEQCSRNVVLISVFHVTEGGFPSTKVNNDQDFCVGHPVEVYTVALSWHRQVLEGTLLESVVEVGTPNGVGLACGACSDMEFDLLWHVWPVVEGFQNTVYPTVVLV